MTAEIVHICFTDSVSELAGRKRTYKNVKAAVLEAGRFSVFDAMQDMKSARIFTKLGKDPEVEIFSLPFPWVGVRAKKDHVVPPQPSYEDLVGDAHSKDT